MAFKLLNPYRDCPPGTGGDRADRAEQNVTLQANYRQAQSEAWGANVERLADEYVELGRVIEAASLLEKLGQTGEIESSWQEVEDQARKVGKAARKLRFRAALPRLEQECIDAGCATRDES